jgi:hypothetical protein
VTARLTNHRRDARVRDVAGSLDLSQVEDRHEARAHRQLFESGRERCGLRWPKLSITS